MGTVHQSNQGVHARSFVTRSQNMHKLSSKTVSRSTEYEKLARMAAKAHSLGLTKVALMVRTGGHFDKVVELIDKMVQKMRDEEAADIEHKDRCEAQQTKNVQDMEDLKHTISETEEKIGRMEDTIAEYKRKIGECESSIAEVETEMKEMLDERNTEHKIFVKALDEDLKAKDLLEKAIEALSAFYKNNKIPMEFAQTNAKQPEYSVDSDKAPETSFGSSYSGRKSEGGGIVGILSMLVEDTEKEIAQGRAEEAEAQKGYEEERDAAQAMKDSITDSKVKYEKDTADEQASIEDSKEFKAQTHSDLGAQEDLEKTLFENCDWIKNEFEDRKAKRKEEIDGMLDAKNMLAGAAPDDDLDMLDF
jgi:hypothetical protein